MRPPLLVAEITAAFASPPLRKIERATPDMAKKVRQRLRSIFDYAVEGGLIVGNPLPAPRRRKAAGDRKHLPATLPKDEVQATMLALAEARDEGKGRPSRGGIEVRPDRQPGCHVSDQPGKQRIGDQLRPVSQQNVRIGPANPGERATPTKTKGKREGAVVIFATYL